jgi:hypothetical protein
MCKDDEKTREPHTIYIWDIGVGILMMMNMKDFDCAFELFER